MATFSSKHPKRTQDFFIKTFTDGLNQEISPQFLPTTALTRCKNMRYFLDKAADGSPIVQVQKRQGTEKISSDALGSAMKACTYYIKDGHYISAIATKLYELNSSSYAQEEIGTIEGRPTFTEFHDKLIIHDSGVTKAWNGSTFETLTNLHTDEILGTGNNSTTQFTGNLAHLTVKPASLVITFTDGTGKTIVSAAGGALTGDVNGGGTNTINYTTGAYDFTCSGAPDTSTTIYATYEQVAGAPKSKAGFVRASRLYVWGSSDYPSRLYYSAPNDEDAWDSSSSGGYIDVDPLDGTSIVGCVNFYAMIIVIKDNSLYRIDNFPGDTVFRVVPLMQNTGALAYQTVVNDGKMVSFLSKQGWLGITSTELYGDVIKSQELSTPFRANAVKFATANCFSEYNQTDKQLWMTLYNGLVQSDVVQVINLETGGQFGLYEFKFGHSCYKFVNGEMLIGGNDGNLYRLLAKGTKYEDNAVSYSSDTYFRSVMTNWGMALNRKHNKKLYVHCYGKSGMTATLNVYTNKDYATPIYTTSLTTTGGYALIWELQSTDIYDMSAQIGAESVGTSTLAIDKKFNYMDIMVEVTNIDGELGAEFYGFDFNGAILGA
jgi:hypothetical protein